MKHERRPVDRAGQLGLNVLHRSAGVRYESETAGGDTVCDWLSALWSQLTPRPAQREGSIAKTADWTLAAGPGSTHTISGGVSSLFVAARPIRISALG